MTNEEKQLLFKDLCVRLPYGTIVHISNPAYSVSVDEKLTIWTVDNILFTNVKPYLRTMSSMTEEEENEYNSLNAYEGGVFPHTEEAFDWLNAHHFDYRGLIEKGLALEAPEDMYNLA